MLNEKSKIAVLGGGSWATAIAKILLTNTKRINWYMRRQDQINEFVRQGKNPSYLSSVKFETDRIRFTSDINHVVAISDILIVATPSPFLKQHLEKLTKNIQKKIIISAIKGIVPDENMIVSDYFEKIYNIPKENIAVIAGPCHAEEVALERLSYLTIGCTSRENARLMTHFFTNSYIYTSISEDIDGIEYSSVMKNIYSLAAGICHGLKYGDNFQAVLLSYGVQEINRFCNAVNPHHRNINDPAYLGDLLVTAYSKFSRNRLFGNMIGKGYSVKTAQMEMEMIAEGYYATRCIRQINEKYKVNIPIVDAVYEILYNCCSPLLGIRKLTEKLAE
jgi:glycerol-3-phosphate dehydrogenase (NAD(P)+)